MKMGVWIVSWILAIAMVGSVVIIADFAITDNMEMLSPNSKSKPTISLKSVVGTPYAQKDVIYDFVQVEICGFEAKIKIEDILSMSVNEKALLSLFLLATQWGFSEYWQDNCDFAKQFIPERFRKEK